MQTKQNKEFIYHFTWVGRCSATSRKAELHHAWCYLERQTSSLWMSLPFLLLPPALYAEHETIWWGHFFWLCPLPTTCTPPSSPLVGWCEKQTEPWCCASPAQQQLKHHGVVNIILILNQKDGTVPGTSNNINSFPAKTSTRRGRKADLIKFKYIIRTLLFKY